MANNDPSIAVVDDASPARTRHLLRLADYQVTAFASGEEFLDSLAGGLPGGSMREAIELLLNVADFSTTVYRSAEDLLEVGLAESDDACVVSDLKLPGISGHELLGNLHSHSWSEPLILITARLARHARNRNYRRYANMTISQRHTFIAAALITALSASAPAYAEESEEELAKATQNPIASLISVPMQYNYDQNIGPQRTGTKNYINVQPVIPFSISEDWNLISRTIVPLVTQSDIVAGSGTQSGLGDITQSLFFSPKKPTDSGLIWGVGPVFLLAAATNDLLGGEKWGVGPTAVFLKQESGWTYGMLANHIWSVAGTSSRSDISSTFLQPFLSFTTKSFTTYGVNTESTYNWKASNSTRWSVPINMTVTQLLKLGGQPLTIQAGARYWAESPDSGPHGWGARFQLTLLFPKK